MNRLVHQNEKSYYTVCLVISLLIYFFLFISIIGIFYIMIGLFITLFLHGISIGHIRNNGVKLTERQFPDIYSRAEMVANEMGIQKLPDIFIVQSGGILNAFATTFLGRNFIVLYSDIVEIAKEGHVEELNFIIAHELAHIKRKHVKKQIWIIPALWIPFLGNAYSRACEFTCDRMAAAYIQSPEEATNALAILAVGKELFGNLNIEEYIMNAKTESGFFLWLSEITSTHPPLPKRIEGIQYFNTFAGIYEGEKAGIQLNTSKDSALM